MTLQTLTIRRPDDWHVHLRDGEMLQRGRALHRAAVRAGDRHAQPGPAGDQRRRGRGLSRADPRRGRAGLHAADDLLSDRRRRSRTSSRAGFAEGVWVAAKLYPADATTNSAQRRHRHRATSARRWSGCRRSACRCCVHGEVTDPDVDVFDREAVFIDRVLSRWSRDFPGAQDRVRAYHHRRSGRSSSRDAPAERRRDDHAAASASSTATRCSPAGFGRMPIACRWPSARSTGWRCAAAATSGSPKFFLGTDSAPHAREAKESACGCAGIFNAPFALESYATVFEEEGALDRFEGFASEHGAALLRPAAQRGHGDAGAGARSRCRIGWRETATRAVPRRRDAWLEARRTSSFAPPIPLGPMTSPKMLLDHDRSIRRRAARARRGR